MSEHRPINPITRPSDELWALVDAACSGRATPAESDRLNALIESDPDVALFYAAYLDLHADLAWRRRGPLAPAFTPATSPNPRAATQRAPGVPNSKFAIRNLKYAAAFAALLLLAAAVAIYVFTLNWQPETLDPKPAAPALVATVIDLTGTLIVNDTIANPGDEMPVGDVALDGGYADFRLDSGVNVSLKGRTQLTVHTPMRATLARGTVEFDVPRQAVGFTVELPDRSRIVDLGTAFRVEVDEAGRAELHVTEGRVGWTLAGESGRSVLVEVGQTARLVDGQPVFVASVDSRGTIFYESFESPRVTASSQIDPAGWTANDLSGGLNHEGVGLSDTPYGEQVAWLNTSHMTTTPAILDHRLAPDTTYTLSLNVGRRDDLGPELDPRHTNAYTVELIAYEQNLAGAKTLAGASGRATRTDFSETVLVEFTPDATHKNLIGQRIAIRLGGTIQAQFDNVRLTARSEPSHQPVVGDEE